MKSSFFSRLRRSSYGPVAMAILGGGLVGVGLDQTENADSVAYTSASLIGVVEHEDAAPEPILEDAGIIVVPESQAKGVSRGVPRATAQNTTENLPESDTPVSVVPVVPDAVIMELDAPVAVSEEDTAKVEAQVAQIKAALEQEYHELKERQQALEALENDLILRRASAESLDSDTLNAMESRLERLVEVSAEAEISDETDGEADSVPLLRKPDPVPRG